MIYLDYNASTPVDPVVREAMLPFLGEVHGNPSSSHTPGRQVRAALDDARRQVAAMIEADSDEIVFTSGGTEANNQAIKGVAESFGNRGHHIVTSAVEHPAVTNPCRYLERHGYEITVVGTDATGRVHPEAVAEVIRPDTILVSIMLANNEVGTLQPVREIARIAHQAGALLHTDAAQACGKIPVSVKELDVDFLSIAGHKLYAPQGVGALFIRSGIHIEPLLHGAGHENGRRAGTEAVSAIVGLGVAARLAPATVGDPHVPAMRDRLWTGLVKALGDRVIRLGHPDQCLPNTLAVAFPRRIGSDILAACPDICASTGAACHSGGPRRSAVLAAMDVPEEVAFGAIRLSVGRFTTEPEVDEAVELLTAAVT